MPERRAKTYIALAIDLDLKNGLYVVFPVLRLVCAYQPIANKPRGLQAARKLRNDRRENRWVRSVSLPASAMPHHLL